MSENNEAFNAQLLTQIQQHIHALEHGQQIATGETPQQIAEGLRHVLKSIKNDAPITTSQVAAAYSSIYTRINQNRQMQIMEIDKLRAFYLVEVMINQMVDDALSPQVGTGDIINVTSTNPDVQTEIDYLNQKFNFDAMSLAVAGEMLFYGDYYFSTVINPYQKEQQSDSISKENENLSREKNIDEFYEKTPTEEQAEKEFGLVKLQDNVDQATIIALTDFTDVKGYLVKRGQKIERRAQYEFVRFSLSPARLRVDLHQGLQGVEGEKIKNQLPRWVRVGRSAVFPVLQKLKELELLEALVPATKLSKLSAGTIIGVHVPVGTSIEDAKQFSNTIESMVNRKVGVDPRQGELSLENIMASSGRIKAVPIFGDSGNLTKMDYKPTEPDELFQAILDLRQVICESVGIPYELLFSIRDDKKKSDILKRYARYLRKLKQVQKAVESGIRQIVEIHLVNKGIHFNEATDINIEFYNRLIEIDNLDKLEFMDTTVGLLKNAKEFIDQLSQQLGKTKKVNVNGFLKFINQQLKVVGLEDIIIDVDELEPGDITSPDEDTPADTDAEVETEQTSKPVDTNLPSDTGKPTDAGTEPSIVKK